MQRGGANRVMAVLCNHFIKDAEIVLVNDIVPDKSKSEYVIEKKVKREFLDANIDHKNTNFHRIKELRRIIREEKPDAIISFMCPPNVRMLLATIGIRVKKIVSVRNDPYKEYGTGVKKALFSLLFCLADGCVFQTEEASKYFPKLVRNKSKVIFNPVDEQFYKTTWKGEKKEIVFVGRLTEQKRPILAIEAFSKLAKDFPEYKLSLYGDGELKDILINTCEQLSLNDRITFWGQSKNIENILTDAALFLLTSDYEGMPNALMEAMAVGIPVIATDCPCGGPRSLIQNSDEGILIPCGNSDELSNAIRKLLCDKEKCKKMSESEKERAKSFIATNVIKDWKHFIE